MIQIHAPNTGVTLMIFLSSKWNPVLAWGLFGDPRFQDEIHNLVDPASSHMLVSKIKPCMSQYKLYYCETANGSLKQL